MSVGPRSWENELAPLAQVVVKRVDSIAGSKSRSGDDASIVDPPDPGSHRGTPLTDPPELRGSGRDGGDRLPELIARIEVELAEHVGQVSLDGACGDEQRLRDLAVG